MFKLSYTTLITYLNSGALTVEQAKLLDASYDKPEKGSYGGGRSGKPKIDIVSETQPKQSITDMGLRELCELSYKTSGQAPPIEEQYIAFIKKMRKE